MTPELASSEVSSSDDGAANSNTCSEHASGTVRKRDMPRTDDGMETHEDRSIKLADAVAHFHLSISLPAYSKLQIIHHRLNKHHVVHCAE